MTDEKKKRIWREALRHDDEIIPGGGTMTRGQGVLKIVFKEVLQQLPPEKADELVAGYNNGQQVVLHLFKNSRGERFKTGLSVGLAPVAQETESQGMLIRWKN